jgi:hypothetical protein
MTSFLASLLFCCLALAGSQPATATPWYATVDHSLQRPPDAGESWDFANGSFEGPLSRETAFEILLKTDTFASSHVGSDGTLSTQVRAFRRVLAEPDAASAFGDLVRRGRMAGQLYGLSGLYLTDRAAFERAVTPYRSSTESVLTFSGCVMFRAPVAELIEDKEYPTSGIAGGGLPRTFQGDSRRRRASQGTSAPSSSQGMPAVEPEVQPHPSPGGGVQSSKKAGNTT